MKIVIYNYNMMSETDDIYTKLISDGFQADDIIIADNGSSSAEVHPDTRFRVPENIRFIGQSFLIGNYLLNYTEDDVFVFITTSAKLNAEVNYRQAIHKAVQDQENWGFIAASFSDGIEPKSGSYGQHMSQIDGEYGEVFVYQPIFMVLSRPLLQLCEQHKAAYFNLDFKRGWGLDFELQYIANSNGLRNCVARDLNITWVTNAGHKKGKMDESLKKYRNEAAIEMNSILSKKYGADWKDKFRAAFDNKDYVANTSRVWRNKINLALKLMKHRSRRTKA